MTQTRRILDELRRRGEQGITPLEALHVVGSFRLAARIADVKGLLGEDEEVVNVGATIDGKTVARYVLRRRVPVPAPVTGTQESIW